MSISASGFFSRKRVGYSTLAVVVAIVAALAFYSIYRSPSSSATATRTVKVTKEPCRRAFQRRAISQP